MENYIYRKKALLTNREELFYKKLKLIADKYNYSIISKVRLADLIELKDKNNYANFNRIKSKHIDFALCNKENLNVVLLIELDDTTHNNKKVIENDRFKNAVLESTGYKLLRVYNDENLEYKINSLINNCNSQNNNNNYYQYNNKEFEYTFNKTNSDNNIKQQNKLEKENLIVILIIIAIVFIFIFILKTLN